MFLKTAFIFCDKPKTNTELQTIMAAHPWAPALIHGLRRIRDSSWADEYYTGSPPDSIYVDTGFDFGDEKWIAESFNAPFCFRRRSVAAFHQVFSSAPRRVLRRARGRVRAWSR